MVSGSGGSIVMPLGCRHRRPALSNTATVNVKVPCPVGVPPTIVPDAPKLAGMDSPGGRLPETIEKVPPEFLLVRMNASYGCPTLPLGRTQTPLTSVPPLVSGEHTSLSALARAGPAVAIPNSTKPA